MFLTILAGSPVWFLAFQATVINLVMAAVVLGQKRSYARLAEALEALTAGPPPQG